MQEVHIKNENGQPKVIVHRTEIHDGKAQFAMSLIEKFGLCAAIPDGEDAAGRQKIRVLTPDELVEKACILADKAIEEIRKREWFTAVPKWEEMEQMIKDKK